MSIYDVARELLQKWYDERMAAIQEIAGADAEYQAKVELIAEYTKYSELINHLYGHAENY